MRGFADTLASGEGREYFGNPCIGEIEGPLAKPKKAVE
jgi:hypothetical protein